MGVDCSSVSALAKALEYRQKYQNSDTESVITSDQDMHINICESADVEQEPTTVNTAVATPGGAALPDVAVLTDEELAEQQKVVENWFSMAKQTLKHNSSSDDQEKYESVARTTISLNSWLLYSEVEKANRIKMAVKLQQYDSLKASYEACGWSRKKWQNRKDLTFEVINQMTEDALAKLDEHKFDIEDLPTLYKANQIINGTDDTESESDDGCVVLGVGGSPKFPIPKDAKFNVVYGDLSYKFDVEKTRKYIHENATGFFWLDDLNISSSITILQKLNFKIQEIAYWNIDKKMNGAFTTRQCRSMVVACKGKDAPKPTDFKLDSIVVEHEIQKSDKKPQYYAERIQLMYPDYPVLEIHNPKFKYLDQNYLINELKGETNDN